MSGVDGRADQLRRPKLADVVAGALRDRIVTGELADGSLLPKQDELLREFRVSRPPLREALRILEAEGLLAVRRGNIGGAVVRAPSAQSAAYTFGLALQTRQVPLSDLAEALRNTEPVAAVMCARRKDRRRTIVPTLRAALKAAADAVDDPVRFTVVSRRFHEEMVRGCGNETLTLMLGTLELMWSQQAHQWISQAAQDNEPHPTTAYRETVVAEHRAMLKGIEAGDAEVVSQVARAHLNGSQRYMLAEGANAVVQAPPSWND